MIGRSIGNYQVVRELAQGGMGTVYLAAHPTIGKKVAIKVLHPHFCADTELVSRFFQEARTVNEIGHPNIVDIADFGKTDDGIVYFVMELLTGKTLRQQIRDDGVVTLARSIPIARQIADALGAAHRAGAVHRDLKPENVFLVEDFSVPNGERVKLFDFGVAKLLGDRTGAGHKTAAGAVLGTPAYMAPEQVLCKPIDARTDIYALGLLLYEMLTGKPPFRSDNLVAMLNAVAKEPAPPVANKRPDAPPWLGDLIMRCLEKDPAERPQSMAEVAAELGATSNTPAPVVMSAPATFPATPPAASGRITFTPPIPQGSIVAMPTAPAAASGGPAWATGATMMATADELGLRKSGVLPALPEPIPPRPEPMPARPESGVRSLGGSAARPEVAPRNRAARWLRWWEDLRSTYGSLSQGQRRIGAAAASLVLVVILAKLFWPFGDSVHETAPPSTQMAVVYLDSRPPGASVFRLSDGKVVGTTPTSDSHPADGRHVQYLFRLPGYVEAHAPFTAETGPTKTLTIPLTPVQRLPPAPRVGGSASAERPPRATSSERRQEKKRQRAGGQVSKAGPSRSTPAPPVASSSPEPKQPVTAPVGDVPSYSLPPLNPSVRVRTLGKP